MTGKSVDTTDLHVYSSVSTVDTKYKQQTFQSYRGSKQSIYSANLYQLFAYLKSLEIKDSQQRQLEGILLYPTVTEEANLDLFIQGHRIQIATVNLDMQWKTIRARLTRTLDSIKCLIRQEPTKVTLRTIRKRL